MKLSNLERKFKLNKDKELILLKLDTLEEYDEQYIKLLERLEDIELELAIFAPEQD